MDNCYGYWCAAFSFYLPNDLGMAGRKAVLDSQVDGEWWLGGAGVTRLHIYLVRFVNNKQERSQGGVRTDYPNYGHLPTETGAQNQNEGQQR